MVNINLGNQVDQKSFNRYVLVEKIINYKIAEDDDDLDNLRNIPPPLFSSLETPFAYK